MSKRVYISADYSEVSGDRDVISVLHCWAFDNLHKVDFVDMAQVYSGSVAQSPDCRVCDLKEEFNRQINASSTVIFIIGDKTASRLAGSNCKRNRNVLCSCTPYKQNVNGSKVCKHNSVVDAPIDGDIGYINQFSYLQHEFLQAVRRNKQIIIVFNSTRKESSWLPSYMEGFENVARPFWVLNSKGEKVGDYEYFKQTLGFM